MSGQHPINRQVAAIANNLSKPIRRHGSSYEAKYRTFAG